MHNVHAGTKTRFVKSERVADVVVHTCVMCIREDQAALTQKATKATYLLCRKTVIRVTHSFMQQQQQQQRSHTRRTVRRMYTNSSKYDFPLRR